MRRLILNRLIFINSLCKSFIFGDLKLHLYCFLICTHLPVRWIDNKSLGQGHLFTGGFLGFDNISVFDRSSPPLRKGFHLAQVGML